MLGELRDRLRSGRELGQALAGGIDVDLRNAEAHVQYRWVPEREAVRDWRTDEEWDAERLLDVFHRLTAVVAGADAAFACFVASHDLEVAPDWLYSGTVSEVFEVLANLTFASRGLEVQRVSQDGRTVVLLPPAESDPTPVLSGLAGYAVFSAPSSDFRIEDTEERVLVEVKSSTLRLFAQADAAAKGLATIAIAYESAARIGMDPVRAGCEFVALSTKAIAVESMQELVDTELSPRAFKNLSLRLNYLRDLTFGDFGFSIPNVAALRSEISRIRALSKQASQGQQSALEMLTKRLSQTCTDADKVGATWPPVSPD